MSEMTVFSNAGLPAVTTDLTTALRSLNSEVGTGGGVAILKMDRTGHWVYGADQTEVEDGSTWAINPFSFTHGYIAWGDGDVLGEKMVPVTEPLPELPPAPPQAKQGWQLQVGVSLKCTTGEDEGLEVRYSATSVGGKRGVQTLAAAIAAQVEKNPSAPVALVELKAEHYQHKSYGRIYTPVFELTGWMGLDGTPAAAVEGEVSAPKATARRR